MVKLLLETNSIKDNKENYFKNRKYSNLLNKNHDEQLNNSGVDSTSFLNPSNSSNIVISPNSASVSVEYEMRMCLSSEYLND